MENSDITLCLPASLASLNKLSSALHDFVAPLSLRPESVYQLDLASCEALTNIIRHAFHYDEQQNIGIRLFNDGRQITLRLSDTGDRIPDVLLHQLGNKPFPAPDPAVETTWREGGMGLQLIHAMVDEMYYSSEEGVNTLILKKKIKKTFI